MDEITKNQLNKQEIFADKRQHVLKVPSVGVISENENDQEQYDRAAQRTSPEKHVIFIDNMPIKSIVTSNGSIEVHQTASAQPTYNSNGVLNYQRTSSTPSMQMHVTREQYCLCSFSFLRCRNWTRREKTLFFILLGLAAVVLTLIVIVSRLANTDDSASRDPTHPVGGFPWIL